MAAGRADARRRAVVVLVATLLAMALTGRLGLWQLDRAAQKEALQSALDSRGAMPELAADLPVTEAAAREVHYRHVVLQGTWMQGSTVYLENRQMNAQPGFFVVTPLLLASGDAVLVQRGWMPRDIQDRTRLQPVSTPPAEVTVRGQIAPPPGRLFEFAGAASGPIRQNLVLTEFSQELGVALRPWSVQQQDQSPAAVDDGLLRQWPLSASDVHKHYGYAFQWFGLCALLAGLYVWFQLVSPRLKRRAR